MTESDKLILIRDELLHTKHMYNILLKDNMYCDTYKTLIGYNDLTDAIYRIEERLLNIGVITKIDQVAPVYGKCDNLSAVSDLDNID